MKSSERTSGRHRWALILPGGDGRRLLPFTLCIRDNDRPKQFCTVMGSETLLQQAQRRISKLIPAVCISPASHLIGSKFLKTCSEDQTAPEYRGITG